MQRLSVILLLCVWLSVVRCELHGIVEVQPHRLDKCPWVPECMDEHLACSQLSMSGQCLGVIRHEKATYLQPSLAVDTAVWCRKSCQLYVDNMRPKFSKEMLELLEQLGDHEDYLTDPFGYPHGLCDLSKGFTRSSRHELIASYYEAGVQHRQGTNQVPKYTKEGVKMSKVPEKAWKLITDWHKKSIKENLWTRENCRLGLTNCQTVEDDGYECSLVKNVTTQLMSLMDPDLQLSVARALQQEAESWSGISLEPNNAYGIRRYLRGAWLAAHIDRKDTHIISAIINVAQDIDEPWPLHIKDHEDKHYQVYLRPGDMVWYESARLPHGRIHPFKGNYFDNVFVHFKPRNKVSWNI